ncbi:MAG: hypothetical protein JNL74_10875, partial [Fibrobacteres bacterium]|nr:hypothetical protein [Fibrobacterota bacterium]
EGSDGRLKLPASAKSVMAVTGDKFLENNGPIRQMNVSPAFVLDTEKPELVNGTVRANNGDAKQITKKSFVLSNPARVEILIQKNDTTIKRLSSENMKPGKHFYSWDGTNEAGVRLFGEYEAVIKVVENGRPEYIIRHKFKADK